MSEIYTNIQAAINMHLSDNMLLGDACHLCDAPIHITSIELSNTGFFNENDFVDMITYNNRMYFCNSCDSSKSEILPPNTCTECKCQTSVFSALIGNVCPKGLWS